MRIEERIRAIYCDRTRELFNAKKITAEAQRACDEVMISNSVLTEICKAAAEEVHFMEETDV